MGMWTTCEYWGRRAQIQDEIRLNGVKFELRAWRTAAMWQNQITTVDSRPARVELEKGVQIVRVETLKQLAARVGISARQARHLVQAGKLRHVMIGSRIHIPENAWPAFIEENTVTVCPDVTTGHDCVGLRSETVSTSAGLSEAAAASAALARQTAAKLKSSSQNSSSSESNEPARVIRLQSS
jgi:excisionase family DNA binding protein